MNFLSQIFFLIPFYMAVAFYCYYEKVRRTTRTAIVSYLIKYFCSFFRKSWIILRVRTKFLLKNFHTKRVIMEIAMMKIFNNCISGRLNNNYFTLNESSSSTNICFAYSITAWKNTYLKNYSKTFNALILTPHSYPMKTIHCN